QCIYTVKKYFFFQAEDGIRDFHVTGVQTCALPIYNVIISQSHDNFENEIANAKALYGSRISGLVVSLAMETLNYDHFNQFTKNRSEERRVGKESKSRY